MRKIGVPGRYVAYALRYKFENIPYNYSSSFKQVGDIISGSNVKLNFRAEGVSVNEVHNLTLAELNRAVNKATGSNRSDKSVEAGFKNLTGDAERII